MFVCAFGVLGDGVQVFLGVRVSRLHLVLHPLSLSLTLSLADLSIVFLGQAGVELGCLTNVGHLLLCGITDESGW